MDTHHNDFTAGGGENHINANDHADIQFHSTPARKLAFVNGVVNFLFGLSMMFLPQLFHNSPVARYVSEITGLASPSWSTDPSAAFDLAALTMGLAFAGITAGQSESNDAYRTIAAINGASGIFGLLTCLLSPQNHGSTYLLFMAIQNLVWYAVIAHAGEFGYMDCFGLSTRGLYVLEERLSRDVLMHPSHRHQQTFAQQQDEKQSYVT